MIDYGIFKISKSLQVLLEALKYSMQRPNGYKPFWIVSCTRNAGDWAVKCLDSVNAQDYPRDCFKHLFINDASNDQTGDLINRWLVDHPGHNVLYRCNDHRLGGTANTVCGFELAPPGSVVIEVNGDDWLSDAGILRFLNKVYADPEIWMTYNSYKFSDGRIAEQCRAYPRRVVRENSFREHRRWISSHLHTFRAEVFSHLRAETLLDPETGQYWESADDMAIYLAMLELCGSHSRHLSRVNYVYNYHQSSHESFESEKSLARALRIKRLPKHAPLDKLS